MRFSGASTAAPPPAEVTGLETVPSQCPFHRKSLCLGAVSFPAPGYPCVPRPPALPALGFLCSHPSLDSSCGFCLPEPFPGLLWLFTAAGRGQVAVSPSVFTELPELPDTPNSSHACSLFMPSSDGCSTSCSCFKVCFCQCCFLVFSSSNAIKSSGSIFSLSSWH